MRLIKNVYDGFVFTCIDKEAIAFSCKNKNKIK